MLGSNDGPTRQLIIRGIELNLAANGDGLASDIQLDDMLQVGRIGIGVVFTELCWAWVMSRALLGCRVQYRFVIPVFYGLDLGVPSYGCFLLSWRRCTCSRGNIVFCYSRVKILVLLSGVLFPVTCESVYGILDFGTQSLLDSLGQFGRGRGP